MSPMMSQICITRGPETSKDLVLTNNDLLTEILIRLPIISIHLFTTVSKQWLQILTSPHFKDRRRKIPNLDPPAGIFATNHLSLHSSLFVSLDARLNSKQNTMGHSFGSHEEVYHGRILQSCNGLLLCTSYELPVFYFVFNPSTNLFKRLPEPNYLHDESCPYVSCVFRLAFDPRKSVSYKVVQAVGVCRKTRIQIYSSETGNWSLYGDRLCYYKFWHFESAVYWNDAFHWQEAIHRKLLYCTLNVEDHYHPIMTTVEIPHGLPRGKKFVESFGGPCNDANLIYFRIPKMLHLEVKFFESCGCLLLACRDDIGSNDFTIYEMMKGSSVWSVRYLVNIEQQLPEGWSIRTNVWSICLGEGEDDVFVVINIAGKLVKYNLISKTNTELLDIRSYQSDEDDAVEFIPHSEFIPSLASV